MSDVNILSLVDECISLLKLESQRRDIQITKRIKGEPFFISADRVGLLQVLINLTKNSIDAIAEAPAVTEGKVVIELVFKEFQVDVLVIDNGSGLVQSADSVMATFFTTKEDGLGLGLAICNEVVNEHDGAFSLNDRDDGQSGCVAKISLKKRGSERSVEV